MRATPYGKAKYVSRKFLNKDRGIACIECDVSQGIEWTDASVTISDCNRTVTLDFSYSNPKLRKRKLDKLSVLISELQKLEQKLLEDA
jgi:hypothetical protein